MSKSKNIPRWNRSGAAMPVIEVLAPHQPLRQWHRSPPSDFGPSVRIELPVPGTKPITITAEVAYGSQWRVEVSGMVLEGGQRGGPAITANVPQRGQALVALLTSMT